MNNNLGLVEQLENSGDQAVSPAGAIGRYQIMPDTARGLGYSPEDMFDPAKNKEAAGKLLDQLNTQFNGDRDAVLTAYNAGPKWAQKWLDSGKNDAILPQETQRYLAHAASIGGSAPPPAQAQTYTPDSQLFSRARENAETQTLHLFQEKPTPETDSPLQSWTEFAKLRADGYSWDDINQAVAQGREEAKKNGWTDYDLDNALGVPHRPSPTMTPPDDTGVIANVWHAAESAASWTNKQPAEMKSLLDDALEGLERVKAAPAMQVPLGKEAPQGTGLATDTSSLALEATSQFLRGLSAKYEAGVNAIVPNYNFHFSPNVGGLLEAMGYGVATGLVSTPSMILNGAAAIAELADPKPKSADDYLNLAFEAGQGLLATAGMRLRPKLSAAEETLHPPVNESQSLADAATAVLHKKIATEEGAARSITPDELKATAQNLMDNWRETGERPIEAAESALNDPTKLAALSDTTTLESGVRVYVNMARERNQEFAGVGERVAGYPASSFSEIAATQALRDAGYAATDDARPAIEDWKSNAEMFTSLLKRVGEDTSGFLDLATNDDLPYPREAMPLPIDPKTIQVKNTPLAENIVGDFKRLLAPWSATPEAEITHMGLRELGARVALAGRRTDQTMARYGRAVASLTVQQKFDYMDAIQTGDLSAFEGTPLGKMAEMHRATSDRYWDEMNKRGLVESYVKDYLRQMWKDQNDTKGWLARRFDTNRDYNKQRVFSTYREGMQAGFIPLTANPEEVMGWQYKGMERAIQTHDFLTHLRDLEIGKFAEDFAGGEREALKNGLVPTRQVLEGKTFYAAKPVVTLLNRYFQHSTMTGERWWTAFRTFQTTMRSAKLALSAFHPALVSLDAIRMGMGDAANQVARGILNPANPKMWAEIPRGIVAGIPKALTAPLWQPVLGRRIFLQAHGLRDYGSQMQELTNRIIRTGVRFGPTEYDYATPQGDFWRAIGGTIGKQEDGMGYRTFPQEMRAMWDNAHLGLENGPAGNTLTAIKFLARTVPRLVQTTTFGMFSHFVPYMKLGAQASRMMDDLRVRPGVGDLEAARLGIQAMKRTENGMGELVTDNLAWNKTIIDVTNQAFNAMSFVLGNVRAVGSGVYELGRGPRKVAGVRDLTPAASYLIGIALTEPLLNFVGGYLSGNWNKDWSASDYYNPLSAAGIHMSLPGIFRWSQEMMSPEKELGTELSMPIHMVDEFLTNKEWNGGYIAKPNEPLLGKATNYLEHLALQFEPLIFDKTGDPATTWLEKEFGIRRAPSDLFPSPKAQRYERQEERSRMRRPREEDVFGDE